MIPHGVYKQHFADVSSLFQFLRESISRVKAMQGTLTNNCIIMKIWRDRLNNMLTHSPTVIDRQPGKLFWAAFSQSELLHKLPFHLVSITSLSTLSMTLHLFVFHRI